MNKTWDFKMRYLNRISKIILTDIDSMQFGFMHGHSTTDAIFILKNTQESHFLAISPQWDML